MTAAGGFAVGLIGPAAADGKGRGVFAQRDIAQGTVVEEACTIELDAEARLLIVPTAIEDYHFWHPGSDAMGLVVLGLASLCNHSAVNNVDTEYRHDPALGWIVALIANREIGAGEEITRHYACDPWFAVAPV
jgi:hypothetical protein